MRNVELNYKEFENIVYQTLNKYYFIKYEKNFGVAVSGGPDSMLLLYVLNRWANLEGKTINVFSFDHNLRKESFNEILFVEKICQKLKCNFLKIRWNEKPETGLMAKARVARYSLIAKKCNQNNIKTLFLGHHANDVAETVSMRIFNNSNLEGLCPIFELREIFNLKLFRPFLCFTKDQILKVILKKNIRYISDPSNLNPRFFRTKIRKLLSEEKKLSNNIIKASILFCKIRNFNNKFIKEKFKTHYSYKNEGFLEVKKEILKRYPKFLVLNFLKMSIIRLGNKCYFTKQKILEKIYLKALQNQSITFSLGGCILIFNKKKIYICREYNDMEKKVKFIESNSKIIWDSRFKIINKTNQLLKILPLGALLNNIFYKKNLKVHKKSIKKIPFLVRKTLPVIFTLEGSVYVPHLYISELDSLKRSIESHTIDFFEKKYDNII